MQVQFGTLLNVYGKPANHAGFTFMPADIELLGIGFSLDYRLSDVAVAPAALGVKQAIEGMYDAAWVRARIPRIFGFTPELPEIEKTLLEVGFVAMQSDSASAIPFVCTDSNGRTGLMFSPLGPDATQQAAIAAAFWSLLLQTPTDLEGFEAKVYHPGAGVWIHYQCRDGDLFCWESDE